MLIALAVLFAPAFGREGEAAAAVPDHHMQMAEGGHCQSPQSGSEKHDKAPQKSCCVSMCMGAAVTPAGDFGSLGPAATPAASGVAALHLSYLGEIATPPPKFG